MSFALLCPQYVFVISIDPLLLMKIVTGFFCGRETSSKKNDNHIACCTVHDMTIYSASVVDVTTVSCLFVAQDIGPPPE